MKKECRHARHTANVYSYPDSASDFLYWCDLDQNSYTDVNLGPSQIRIRMLIWVHIFILEGLIRAAGPDTDPAKFAIIMQIFIPERPDLSRIRIGLPWNTDPDPAKWRIPPNPDSVRFLIRTLVVSLYTILWKCLSTVTSRSTGL
jgi:hypothetical protein